MNHQLDHFEECESYGDVCATIRYLLEQLNKLDNVLERKGMHPHPYITQDWRFLTTEDENPIYEASTPQLRAEAFYRWLNNYQ